MLGLAVKTQVVTSLELLTQWHKPGGHLVSHTAGSLEADQASGLLGQWFSLVVKDQILSILPFHRPSSEWDSSRPDPTLSMIRNESGKKKKNESGFSYRSV